jgi:glycine reductase
MQEERLKIVHYLNQFFGGIGGEDKADIKPLVKQGAVGPGRAAQQTLGENGSIIATVVCGDNYFSEKIEDSAEEVLELITPFSLTPPRQSGHAGRCHCLWRGLQDRR